MAAAVAPVKVSELLEQYNTNVNYGNSLSKLNARLLEVPYIGGFLPSQDDISLWGQIQPCYLKAEMYPHVLRWWQHIASFSAEEKAKLPGQLWVPEQQGTAKPAPAPEEVAEEEEAPAEEAAPAEAAGGDEDFDPFAEGAAEKAQADAKKLLAQKKKEEKEKADKAKKAAPVAKSSVIIEVKPEESDTDMELLKQKVLSIAAEGLRWGFANLQPVAYGINKLVVNAIVIDDLVSADWIQETIESLPEVQSTDIAAFNKL